MVEYINDSVRIKPQAKIFFKEIDKKELPLLVNYLYYYYDEESIYASVLPEERKILCLTDVCKGLDLNKHKDFIAKYENTIMSITKRLAYTLDKRIEKLITMLETLEVDIDDIEKEGKNMKGLTEIFKLKEVLTNKLAKESNIVEGKGSKDINPFETSTF